MQTEFKCPKCKIEAPKRGTCPTCKVVLEEMCPGCGKAKSNCDC